MRNYRQWSVFSKRVAALLLVVCCQPPLLAAVNVDRTRVIFAADDVAQSLTLVNESEAPMLLQAWTDAGDPASSPDTTPTPVVALPPVFRMQPSELRTLRLMLSSRQGLAQDRESLVWLNLYQIPPLSQEIKRARQKVVIPLRLRLKVFIRPAGLGSPDDQDAQKLRFEAQGNALRIVNPTAWYMSLALTPPDGKRIDNLMIPPLNAIEVPVTSAIKPGARTGYSVIDDWGNWQPHIAIISPGPEKRRQ